MLKYLTGGGGGLLLLWIISLFMKKYDDKTKKTKHNNNIIVETKIDIIDCDDWAWDQFVSGQLNYQNNLNVHY